MDFIVGFFGGLSSLGVSVVMPIVLTIIGVLFGAGFGKSLKAGLTVGIGFIGLNLVINQLMGTDLAGAVTAMVTRFGCWLACGFCNCYGINCRDNYYPAWTRG